MKESEEESAREMVESLCGDVWVVASKMLSFESLKGGVIGAAEWMLGPSSTVLC
jgi:hypothetical protein